MVEGSEVQRCEKLLYRGFLFTETYERSRVAFFRLRLIFGPFPPFSFQSVNVVALRGIFGFLNNPRSKERDSVCIFHLFRHVAENQSKLADVGSTPSPSLYESLRL